MAAGHMDLIPTPLRAALGLVVSAVEQVRALPDRAPDLPVQLVSNAMQASMRAQQRYAELTTKGDELLAQLRGTSDEPPAWATFDEEVDETEAAETGRRLVGESRAADLTSSTGRGGTDPITAGVRASRTTTGRDPKPSSARAAATRTAPGGEAGPSPTGGGVRTTTRTTTRTARATGAEAAAGPRAAKAGPTKAGPTKAGPTKPAAKTGSANVSPTESSPTKTVPTKAGPTKAGPTKAAAKASRPVKSGPRKAGPAKSGPRKVGPAKSGPREVGPARTLPGTLDATPAAEDLLVAAPPESARPVSTFERTPDPSTSSDGGPAES